MTRKVFISVLGTTKYGECTYFSEKTNYKSKSVHYIQEATLENIGAKDWGKEDFGYVFVTEEAKNRNWFDNGHKIPLDGLETRIRKLELPFMIEAVDICDGNNDQQIWELFDVIFSKLKEGDELYFDITHGYRYLPMLILVLANYTKFLKSISVKQISYGYYDITDPNNKSRIVDLTTLSILQDWAAAAQNFIEIGNVKGLVKLANSTVSPILKETRGKDLVAKSIEVLSKELPFIMSDMQTCRGKEIINGEKVKKVQGVIRELEETSIKPFNPIFKKLRSKLLEFGASENVKNGFIAAKWCHDNGLIQQSITILFESIISLVCEKTKMNYQVEKDRNMISSIFKIKKDSLSEEEWKGEAANNKLEIRRILQEPIIEILYIEFSWLRQMRNDINHSGMVNGPTNALKFESSLKELLCSVIAKTYNL